MKSGPGVLVLLTQLVLSLTNTASLDMESQLESLLLAALDKHLPTGQAGAGRERRQVQSAQPGALMYLPIGGNSNFRSSPHSLSSGGLTGSKK